MKKLIVAVLLLASCSVALGERRPDHRIPIYREAYRPHVSVGFYVPYGVYRPSVWVEGRYEQRTTSVMVCPGYYTIHRGCPMYVPAIYTPMAVQVWVPGYWIY